MRKIGNIRKRFLTRERLMLIVEYLVSPSKQRQWTDSTRRDWEGFLADYTGNIERLYLELRYQVFAPAPFKIFEKKEGEKIRRIYASYPREQIVDLLLTDCLEYVFTEKKRLIPSNCYGSIKGKGQHAMRRKIIRMVRGRKDLHVYKGDTRKYYPTMDHDYLKRILRTHIKDQWMLWLCDLTIDRMKEGKGVALGLPSSNILGHVYHSEIDWTIIKDYGFKHYYRFCDDKFIISEDKNYLHTGARVMRDLVENAGQHIKEDWRVLNCAHQQFDCLGALINSKTARLRPASRRTMERRMRKIQLSPYKPMECLRAWSGMKGSLRDLNVEGLLRLWKDRYAEFFRRIGCDMRQLRRERIARRKHKRLERILTNAVDCRTVKIPFDEPIHAKEEAA